jgi:hypothetical protein
MSLKERVQQMETNSRLKENAAMQIYKSDKNFRADRLIEAWSRIPEIGAGLKEMDISTARNIAINLDRQTAFMQSLRESQLATALNDFTPENMLRLVRLAMPNIIRNKVFTEFALETTKDSIKYIRPFFSKTANGHPLNDKSPDYDGFNDTTDPEYDPWGYSKGGEFNGDDFRKALYEDTRDRANQELANAIVATADVAAPGALAAANPLAAGTKTEYAILFKKIDEAITGISAEAKFESGKWGVNGSLYVDGYAYIYGYNAGDSLEKVEQQVIAIQDKGSGQFFAAPGFNVTLTKSATVRDKFLVAPPKIAGTLPDGGLLAPTPVADGGLDLADGSKVINPGYNGNLPAVLASTGVMIVEIEPLTNVPTWFKDGETGIRVYGRYNSESDFEGNYLGEVEIRMDEYMFKPSPTSIGVSWSQLTEITLDTSFNISAEEYLVSYASQEIRSALDYRAIRLAYAVAKTNAKHNPNYYYVFDAAYNTVNMPGATTPPSPPISGTKDGYRDNAQTFVNAIDAIGDVIYDEINRGGVSRLVAGPSACSYMHLNVGYSPKGKQNQSGSHQFGELDGMPLFKVPSSIIPTNEVLCVWKNDAVENDVSIAFGTLIPFFSTGVIQRKNFYKEAGLATYGDWAVLNRRYLAIIAIANLKDINNARDGL